MNLESRVEALEERVSALESERPGRKALQILVSAEGICGVEPAIDSATCPFGSLYRRRRGCLGTACQLAAAKYYADYRSTH